jgi:transcriptional regulator with XRE-family HTH domain
MCGGRWLRWTSVPCIGFGALYRILAAEAGVSQRQIAALIGQSQPEVSEIVSSRRRVESYQLLVRIAESLGIPREFMGLSWWGPDGAYCGEARVVESPEEDGGDAPPCPDRRHHDGNVGSGRLGSG